MNRSIDRLQTLTGKDAVTWKKGRVRWLLASPDDQEKAASAAVVLLIEVIHVSPGQYYPHTQLASAYEKLSDLEKEPKARQTSLANSISEWKQASELNPNSAEVLYNLIRVSARAGTLPADAGEAEGIAGELSGVSARIRSGSWINSPKCIATVRPLISRPLR